jgi:hypothetical protein
MLGCDVFSLLIILVSSEMFSGIVLPGVFGLTVFESLLMRITGILGSLHQDCSRGVTGHIGLLHGFNELVLDML